jgi:hypothetical protein
VKRNWRRIGWITGLIALVGVVGLGSVAFAQSNDDPGWAFDYRTKVRGAIADILGITVEEYNSAVETAESQVIDEAIADGWLTEEQAKQMQERLEQNDGFAGPGMGRGSGMGPGMGQLGTPQIEHDSFLSVAAELLGLSETDLQSAMQEGKTTAELAEEKGVDAQEIVDEYVARYTEQLNQAVQSGDITQGQADSMLENATQRATDQLENAFAGRMMGEFGRGGRPGGMRGMPNGEAPDGMRGYAPNEVPGWDSGETAGSAETGGL